MDVQFIASIAVVAADPPKSRELFVECPRPSAEDWKKGFEILHDAREEPWGQTVARFLSIEGSIIGISYAPSPHAAGISA